MDRFKRFCQVALPALVLLTFSGKASAQEFKQGDREFIGYLGGLFSGNQFVIGGGYGYAIRPRIQILGELGVAVGGGSHGVEFHGDVAYLFPLKAYPMFTPYVIGGFGIFHQSCTVVFVGDCSATTGGLDFGGGARWQAGKNWGIRPEVKFLAGNHFGTRVSGGIYYQFGK